MFIAPPTASIYLDGLPDTGEAVHFTLKTMSRLVSRFKRDPEILGIARTIVFNIPQKKASLEVSAVQKWVRAHIRYVRDVRGVETLQWPTHTLAIRQGDCDDQALLVASLLEAIGYATRFVAVGKGMFGAACHVFTEVKLGRRWVSIETTEDVMPGWRPSGYSARVTIHN